MESGHTTPQPQPKPKGRAYLNQSHRLLASASAVALALLAWGFWSNEEAPTEARHADRANPWRGLPGCLWVAGPHGAREYWPTHTVNAMACQYGAVPTARPLDDDEAPKDAEPLVNALQPWLAAPPQSRPGAATAPSGTYANAAGADTLPTPVNGVRPRVIPPGQRPVLQGADVQLALKPESQRKAQQLLECMTGNTWHCEEAGVSEGRWRHHYEEAAVRMAALVQIDIATGAIEVMASANTLCFMLTTARSTSKDCPPVAHAPREWQSGRQDNHALYTHAMPGSLVKPVIALALLRGDLQDALLGSPLRAKLLEALRQSDTPTLLDWLYCKDSGFASSCARPQQLAAAAADLGWQNTTWPVLATENQALHLPGGRLFMEPKSSGMEERWRSMALPAISTYLRADCAKRQWSECKSAALAAQTAELWGTGNAQATPLGVAATFARLGAAANGSFDTAMPQLAARIETGEGVHLPLQADHVDHGIAPAHARLIVEGMGLTHTAGGTAHSACLAVFGSAKACNSMPWLSGKTGTPGFRHDRLTLAQRNAVCATARAREEAAERSDLDIPPAVTAELARCNLPPVKWYAALVKESDDADAPYTKAIVVLAERNWVKATGKVDSALDRGTPNVAAEAAMRYIAAERGLPTAVQARRGTP